MRFKVCVKDEKLSNIFGNVLMNFHFVLTLLIAYLSSNGVNQLFVKFVNKKFRNKLHTSYMKQLT